MADQTDETSRASVTVTHGMAQAALRGRPKARECRKCGRGVPRYPGRYPGKCPTCGGKLRTVREGLEEGDRVVEAVGSTVAAFIAVLTGNLTQYDAANATRAARAGRPVNTYALGHYLAAVHDVGAAVKGMESREDPEAMKVLAAAMSRSFDPAFPPVKKTLKAIDAWIRSGARPKYPMAPREGVVVVGSLLPHLQALIEAGAVSDGPYGGDPTCSSACVVPYAKVAEHIAAGVRGLDWFLESGPTPDRAFRVEQPDGPVLIFEFDDIAATIRIFATHRPEKYLGHDPRAGLIVADEDGLEEGAASLEDDVDEANPYRVTKKSVLANRPDGAHRVHGGFRFLLGKNRNRKPVKDVVRAIQNKRNSRRGLAARIKAAKKFHRSSDGKAMHRALGHYNTGNRRGEGIVETTRAAIERSLFARINRDNKRKLPDGRREVWVPGHVFSRHSISMPAGARNISGTVFTSNDAFAVLALEELDELTLRALARVYGARVEALGEAFGIGGPEAETVDDVFESLIRRLVVSENIDVLQDVEFADDGSIYLFFDPSLTPLEAQEVTARLAEGHEGLTLVASPDRSLPGETAESDWWVVFMPRKGADEGVTQPDPNVYTSAPSVEARPGDAEPPRASIVRPAMTDIDTIARGVDLSKLVRSVGEAVEGWKLRPGVWLMRPASWGPSFSRVLEKAPKGWSMQSWRTAVGRKPRPSTRFNLRDYDLVNFSLATPDLLEKYGLANVGAANEATACAPKSEDYGTVRAAVLVRRRFPAIPMNVVARWVDDVRRGESPEGASPAIIAAIEAALAGLFAPTAAVEVVEGVADIILSQLRVPRSVMMSWGPSQLLSLPDGLQFNVNGGRFKGRVIVKYDRGHDLYDVTFGRVRQHEWKVFKELHGIDAENLTSAIDGVVEGSRYDPYGGAPREHIDTAELRWRL